jgi:hypothetical protein
MQIDDRYWPLIPGAVRLTVLDDALPLSFEQLAEAFRRELLSIDGLSEIIQCSNATVNEPSELLKTFLRTSSTFDRARDVQEELNRLALSEQRVRPPLWKVLAMLITRRPVDDVTKLYALESLFQTFDQPAELRPYTMYGDIGKPPFGARASIDELRAKLDMDFVQN